ncbi:MAG: hypothetical protein ACLUP5_01525 [Streptococcus sp.]
MIFLHSKTQKGIKNPSDRYYYHWEFYA